MNYKQIYDSLINRGLQRTLPEDTYFEKHHIIPKCMGGLNDSENLVKLTPEEHYVAHQLLVKIYPEVKGLSYAAKMMTVTSKFMVRTNKLYGWVKRAARNACVGKIISLETRKKLSEAGKGKAGKANLGKKASEETKKKMSIARIGKIRSEDTISKTAKSNTGQRRSEESKKKMSLSALGKIISKDTALKISKANRGRKQSEDHILKRVATRAKNKLLKESSINAKIPL